MTGSEDKPKIPGIKCSSLTKAGNKCPFPAFDTSGVCVGHHADRSKLLSARGKLGAKAMHEALTAKKRAKCQLRCTDDLLTELEKALLDAERSGGNIAIRAKTKTGIISAAHAILKTAELETENADLKQLLIERHPELSKVLRVVK